MSQTRQQNTPRAARRSLLLPLSLAILCGLLCSCGAKTTSMADRVAARHAQIVAEEDALLADWEQLIAPEHRHQVRARMVAHHVRLQARPEVLREGEQLQRPELVDGEPVLTAPDNLRRVNGPTTVVLACVVETTGLVRDCIEVHGDEYLRGHVLRTVMQWSYLPAAGYDEYVHPAGFLFVVPFDI